MFRFTIRELLLLLTVVALISAWAVDHERLTGRYFPRWTSPAPVARGNMPYRHEPREIDILAGWSKTQRDSEAVIEEWKQGQVRVVPRKTKEEERTSQTGKHLVTTYKADIHRQTTGQVYKHSWVGSWSVTPTTPLRLRAPAAAAATTVNKPRPAQRVAKISPSDLKREGAPGFPQTQARVLRDEQLLRVSLATSADHLFVQAIVWNDDDQTLGETPDGRKQGDNSVLLLDVDADGLETAQVDRRYSLNPWPARPGLHYSVVLGKGRSTTLKDDSRGRGSIQYLQGTDGRRYRVDSFVIPLSEIGKQTGETLRLAYWGSSPHPAMTFNSIGFERPTRYYAHQLPRDKYHEVPLTAGVAFDVQAVPDGREENAAAPARASQPLPPLGSVPPELTAANWINVETPPTLAKLRGQSGAHRVLGDLVRTLHRGHSALERAPRKARRAGPGDCELYRSKQAGNRDFFERHAHSLRDWDGQ